MPHQAGFLREAAIGPADMHTVRGRLDIVGDDDFHPVRPDIGGGRAFDRIGQAFHADPGAAVAGHGDAIETIVEIFLHGGRV